MRYWEQLKHGEWLRKKAAILIRDDYRCRICGSPENVQIHHLKYSGLAWQVKDSDLITVCDNCHVEFENDKKLKEDNILTPVIFDDAMYERLYQRFNNNRSWYNQV